METVTSLQWSLGGLILCNIILVIWLNELSHKLRKMKDNICATILVQHEMLKKLNMVAKDEDGTFTVKADLTDFGGDSTEEIRYGGE